MEKKCSYCAMMIPKEANVCPHCRKKMPISSAAGFIIIIISTIAIISILISALTPSDSTTPTIAYKPIHKDYEITWKKGVKVGLLVPTNTSKEQLKNIVYEFKQAKQNNTLSGLIPPVNTTAYDKYAIFTVLIFSDPKWSNPSEYDKYSSAITETAKDKAIVKAYLNHIAAYYEFGESEREHGALGYNDGADKSIHYKKLF